MSAHLYLTQKVAAPSARLNPGNGDPFAVVELCDDGTYMSIGTAEEAYALRDAFQRAGDLLAGTRPPAEPRNRTLSHDEDGER